MIAFGIQRNKKKWNQPNKKPQTPHPTTTNNPRHSVDAHLNFYLAASRWLLTLMSAKALQREAHISSFLRHIAKNGLPLFSANQALLYPLLGYSTGHIPAGCLTYIPVLLDESHFGWFVLSTPRIVIFQISHGSFGWKHWNVFNLNTFKTNQPAPWPGHLCCTYCLRVHFASHECQQVSVSHCDCTICLLICKTGVEWRFKLRNETVTGATTTWSIPSDHRSGNGAWSMYKSH